MTREPFFYHGLWTKYYIITSPFDVGGSYTNLSTLSWDGFLNETLTGFGVDLTRLNILWEKACCMYSGQSRWQVPDAPKPRPLPTTPAPRPNVQYSH